MDAARIIVTALIGTMLALVLKEQKPYMGVALSFICAMCVFFMALPYLEKVITYVKVIYDALGGEDTYIDILLKIAGIAILSSLGSSLCSDAGMSAVSNAVVISGKVICMCQVLPVAVEFLGKLLSVIP